MSNFSGRVATPITIHLLIINVLMLLATQVLRRRGIELDDLLGLHYYDSSNFHGWQFVTYMFMHADFTHLFNNMFTLFMFGRLLEDAWGERRFLAYYFITGIGAGIMQQLAWRFEMHDLLASALLSANPLASRGEIFGMSYAELLPYCRSLVDSLNTVGASGSVFGILLAFGMMFPNAEIYLLFPPIPMKAKWLVIGYGLFELVAGISGAQPGVAHYAHLGGMLFGFILIMIWKNHRNTDFY